MGYTATPTAAKAQLTREVHILAGEALADARLAATLAEDLSGEHPIFRGGNRERATDFAERAIRYVESARRLAEQSGTRKAAEYARQAAAAEPIARAVLEKLGVTP